MQQEIKITGDGTPTIYIPELDEHYHSVYGAYNESMHVFIQNGFHYVAASGKSKLHILEIGLGTGLNTLLTLRENNTTGLSVFYQALEPYPLSSDMIGQIQFNIAGLENANLFFRKIHEAISDEIVILAPQFHFEKTMKRLEDFNPSIQYDLIYFDAFGPRAQPEIWSLDNFKKLYDALVPGGILVTYCAKGDVRRTMLAAGFNVERLPGPPGKREMLRAMKLM